MMPETVNIASAKIIHGHQWEWGGEPWALIHAEVNESPVFYGHSLFQHYRWMGSIEEIEFGVPYNVSGKKVLVNVGAVVKDREWVFYNLADRTVTFMKV